MIYLHWQLEELHRLYRKQKELMEKFKDTLIGQSNEQMESILKTVKVQVGRGTDDAPVTPETMDPSMTQGKQVDQVRLAVEALVDMSSPLLLFANIVTSVKGDADLAFLKKSAQKPRVAVQTSRQQKARQMQIPSQHCKNPAAKKLKCTSVEPKACIGSWGKITNGRRSPRVRDKKPMSTFIRGALMCKWK